MFSRQALFLGRCLTVTALAAVYAVAAGPGTAAVMRAGGPCTGGVGFGGGLSAEAGSCEVLANYGAGHRMAEEADLLATEADRTHTFKLLMRKAAHRR